ncbi:MAG: 3-deoxy-7-phosphoheptulonate synthase [bacterium]
MIILLRDDATREERAAVIHHLSQLGMTVHESDGMDGRILGVVGDEDRLRDCALDSFPGVDKVVPLSKPYKLASREFRPDGHVVTVGPVEFGGKKIPVIAGPCSIENRKDFIDLARRVKAAGASIVRGGAFKPRTSPYSFQGLGLEGLKILAETREATGLRVCTEVMDTRDVEMVATYSDILQVGARNVQNFNLLKEVGKVRKPVLLKRGLMTTLTEFLMSAEYILSNGNYEVILCERGIRGFDTATRNMFDLTAIPVLHAWTHLPVIADPSHGTGKWRWVAPMARAAVACGADGLMIEVHATPETAYSDGDQSLLPEKFALMMGDLRKVARAVGRAV